MSAELQTKPSAAPLWKRLSGWRRVFLRVAHWVEPVGEPAEAIYGTLIAAAVIATRAESEPSTFEMLWTVLVVLALYWLAHVYADVVGERLRTRERPGWRDIVSHALRDWSMLRGALIPLVIFGIARGVGATVNGSVLTALWTTVLLLAAWGLVAAIRSGAHGLELLIEALVCAALGVLVLILKIFIH